MLGLCSTVVGDLHRSMTENPSDDQLESGRQF
jgi:hypothetical protein